MLQPDGDGDAAAAGGRGGSSVGSNRLRGSVEEFIPTTLGVALIEGYENLEFETSLSKPFLRKQVCDFALTGEMWKPMLTVPNSDGAADEGHLRGPTHP